MRASWKHSALVIGFALAGCEASLNSTPTPPPPPAYTKIADMTGDRTFETGGVQYATSTTGISNATAQAFGSGVTIAYTQATDSYRLTAPDSSTVTFDPSNAVAPAAPNTQQWTKVSGPVRDDLSLTVPTVDGVALSYTVVGAWQHADSSTGQALTRLAVGGAPTLAADMPRTGTATYATETGGTALRFGTPYALGGHSSATFSADFARNTVTTSLTLAGTPQPGGTAVTSFGTFNGTGTIASTGPGFTGTFNGGSAIGAFSGAFFGPRALEMAYSWYLNGGDFSAAGTAAGVKK
jgi:hypothetical protein